ncbi:hypothetical protein ACTFIZ_001569 [Dictyostelium cf. discoideum]
MKIILSLIVFIATISLIANASESYYAIRSDFRKCAYPMCGGYFVHEIGSNKSEVYVKSLNQTDKGGGGSTVDESLYKFAPPYTIVVKGDIKKDDIIVSRLFRLLPKPDKPFNFNTELNNFYIVDPKETNSNIEIKKLNSNKSEKLNSIENSYSQDVSLVPMDWLKYKVTSGESVFTVSGRIDSNKTISIDYMFISLPDPKSLCPKELVAIRCANDTIPTYNITATRCLSFSGCVHRGVCPLVVPGCPDGYSRNSYASKPNGCLRYYCIPSFLS